MVSLLYKKEKMIADSIIVPVLITKFLTCKYLLSYFNLFSVCVLDRKQLLFNPIFIVVFNCNYYLLNNHFSVLFLNSTQSAEVVEYTECISAGIKPPAPSSVLNMTSNHLMVKLLSWSFWDYGVLLHCHCTQAHSDLEW